MSPARARFGPAIEAFAFSAGVLVDIWFVRRAWPPFVFVLLLSVAVSFWRHRETMSSLGLGFRQFTTAMDRWKLWWLLAAATIFWLAWGRENALPLLGAGARYLLWCIVQQLIYQNMVYKRLAESMGRSSKSRAIAAALFSAMHFPNPVLMPATLAWGFWSSKLFDDRPSVPALGVAQFLLSGALLRLTPVSWSRGFRAGPGYFEFFQRRPR